MKKINLGSSGLIASEISLGCMRICGLTQKEADELIDTAINEEISLFDHADIYGDGKSEEMFGKAIRSASMREKMIIQTKCAIHDGLFDFSKDHILKSVDKSLQRLNQEYVDILLLHRPDTLFEPEEVAEAFATLKSSGKVKYFGVSNQSPMQIELLQKYTEQRLIINQLQFSLTNTTMLDCGFNVNMQNAASVAHDGSVLEYCRLKDITIQPWSPFQYGFFEGVFIGSERFPELNKKLDELAEKYNVTSSAIAIAWILRHPAKMQPIVGTTNKKRLSDICKASDTELSRAEWYELYKAAGNILP